MSQTTLYNHVNLFKDDFSHYSIFNSLCYVLYIEPIYNFTQTLTLCNANPDNNDQRNQEITISKTLTIPKDNYDNIDNAWLRHSLPARKNKKIIKIPHDTG